MSTVRRIAELYETTMNAVLDRVANPRELADYSYTQLRELLAEVQRDTVQVAASRKHAERRVSELRRSADRLGEPGGTGDDSRPAGPRMAGVVPARSAPGSGLWPA